jgi:hypothetical protein
MKLSVAFVCVLLTAASIHARVTDLETAVQGQVQQTETGELRLRGTLFGDMPGTLELTLNMSPDGVALGHWTLTKVTTDANGVEIEIGALSGMVSRGSSVALEGGQLVALRDVELKVSEGSGEFADTTEGTGRIDVRFDPLGAGPFRADLTLTF